MRNGLVREKGCEEACGLHLENADGNPKAGVAISLVEPD